MYESFVRYRPKADITFAYGYVCSPINRHRQIVYLLIHAIQTLALRWTLKRSTLMLWLYQRHALETFRASVGDVDGHKTNCKLVGLKHNPNTKINLVASIF
jgi:hypothetical protein